MSYNFWKYDYVVEEFYTYYYVVASIISNQNVTLGPTKVSVP